MARYSGEVLSYPMKLVAAWLQIIFVVLIVGYGTWQLYRGHFQETFATLPLLFAYYIFVIARSKKRSERSKDDSEPD